MREQTITDALHQAFDVSRGRAKYSTIRERIVTGSRIDGIHLCQLIAAMIIASVGLNIDSTEAIIGAMLICPLMGSVMAMAYGIAVVDMHMFRRALAGLLLQCGICLVTSTLYFVFTPLSITTPELLTNSTASIWVVIIALVGGFAGALGLSRRQEPATLLSGVAVATALMPPLCSVGYGLASNDSLLALSALYNFLINVVFICFGATAVLVWLHLPMVDDFDGDGKTSVEDEADAPHKIHSMRTRMIVGLVAFAIPCIYFSWVTIQRSIAESGSLIDPVDSYNTTLITQELELVCPDFEAYRIGLEESYDPDTEQFNERLVATITTSEELSSGTKRQIEGVVHLHVIELDDVVFEVSTEGEHELVDE